MKLFEDLPSQNTPITAENLNKLIESEVITNDNGKAIKYPDGTMICTATIVVDNEEITTPYQDMYFTGNNFTFPVEFIDIPNISITAYSSNVLLNCSIAKIEKSMFSVNTFCNQSKTGITYGASYTAIGRWK